MKDFEESKSGIGGDMEGTQRLIDCIDAEYEARRKLDPNKRFSYEERAEIIDAAKAAAGLDTSKKTDPAQLAKDADVKMKILADVNAFLDKVGEHGIGGQIDDD